MVDLEIDNKAVSVEPGTTIIEAADDARNLYSPVLLSQKIIDCRQLPHVFSRS